MIEGRPKTGCMTEVDGIPDSLPKAVVYTPFRALPLYACVSFVFTRCLLLFAHHLLLGDLFKIVLFYAMHTRDALYSFHISWSNVSRCCTKISAQQTLAC